MTRSFKLNGKVYTVYPEDYIECDWAQCGEWHNPRHTLYDLLEETDSPVIELVKDNK